MDYLVLGCRFLIGALFLVAAGGKILRPAARAALAVLVSGITGTTRGRPVVAAVICAEAAVVVLIALPGTARLGLAAAAALLAAFAVAIGVGLRRGVGAPCPCFGTTGAPLGAAHLVRNALLTAIALTGALAAQTTAPTGAAAGALTGLLTGSPTGAEPAGVALSLGAGAVLTLVFVFFDDIAALFAASDPTR